MLEHFAPKSKVPFLRRKKDSRIAEIKNIIYAVLKAPGECSCHQTVAINVHQCIAALFNLCISIDFVLGLKVIVTKFVSPSSSSSSLFCLRLKDNGKLQDDGKKIPTRGRRAKRSKAHCTSTFSESLTIPDLFSAALHIPTMPLV
jgi:hypothetical protein